MPEVCSNPVCENLVVSHPRAARPRRFCSNECKLNGWAFKRVAEMLLPLGPARAREILDNLTNEDTQGKGQVEIVNPRAIVSEIL